MAGKNIYTDLALEAAETLMGAGGGGIGGVRVEEETPEDGLTVTTVRVLDEDGAARMGRPVGTYVTLQSANLKTNDADAHEAIIRVMSDKLAALVKKSAKEAALVVGLGNRFVTPDSLGPQVVSKILVTRHIADELNGLPEPLRPVGALSPGVMGMTGIETAEIVKGVTERVKPGLVIAVDALAARATSRINATIQISDTGVAPGGGMGNKRMTLDEAALGVPVIAIGVPTVVDAATLVNDAMDLLLADMIQQTPEGSPFYQTLKDLEADEKYDMLRRILNEGNMFVTPREVDDVIARLSNIIANALNISLHPGISKEDVNRYMY